MGIGGNRTKTPDRRLIWLFFIAAFPTVCVYGQQAKSQIFVDRTLLACLACDSDIIQHNMGGEDAWRTAFNQLDIAPSRLAADSWNDEHTRIAASRGVNLLAQNQAKPPEGQAKKEKQYSPSATTGSPGHIFWVIPAYKVDYGKGFQPLSPKEKFEEWARAGYDPLGLGAGAVEAATLEYSSRDGFCGYGHGWGGYGECFGSLQLDATNSSFIGDFVLPVLMHQDPRYFRLGEGSFGRRMGYAISRVFVTYNDSGHTVFFTSALSGTVIAAGLSNLYYPAQDVNFSHTMTRIAIDLGNTALYNLAAEFWPDIHRKLRHIF
jgi:hypothetical protein